MKSSYHEQNNYVSTMIINDKTWILEKKAEKNTEHHTHVSPFVLGMYDSFLLS